MAITVHTSIVQDLKRISIKLDFKVKFGISLLYWAIVPQYTIIDIKLHRVPPRLHCTSLPLWNRCVCVWSSHTGQHHQQLVNSLVSCVRPELWSQWWLTTQTIWLWHYLYLAPQNMLQSLFRLSQRLSDCLLTPHRHIRVDDQPPLYHW